MTMLGNRRPRGFHHTYIYTDNRKRSYKDMQQRESNAASDKNATQMDTADLRLRMTVPRDKRGSGAAGLSGGSLVLFAVLFLIIVMAVYAML